jgi:hypothetical protein
MTEPLLATHVRERFARKDAHQYKKRDYTQVRSTGETNENKQNHLLPQKANGKVTV